MTPIVLWKAAPLRTKSWQDGVAVYNIDSGSTHLLSPAAGKILEYLSRSPTSASYLAHRLADKNRVEADSEVHYNIDRLLQHLNSLGLVEPLTRESL